MAGFEMGIDDALAMLKAINALILTARKMAKIDFWRATADEDGQYCFAVAL
jgi:hypothetical protein